MEAHQTGGRVIAGRRRQGGFSYVEVLVAIMVLAITATGLIQGITQSSAVLGRSRADSIANNIGAARADQAHRMPYAELGTLGGNPHGRLAPVEIVRQGAIDFRVATSVAYVNDPALGQPVNYANYKKVTITVTPTTGSAKGITQTTVVAPPSIAAIAGRATALVSVTDALTGRPVPGVSVRISTDQSPTGSSETTDAQGRVVFAGLAPNSASPGAPDHLYRLSATKAGFVTHRNYGPAQVTQHLEAGQTWTAELKVFQPATIYVRILDRATRQPLAGLARATLSTPTPVRLEAQTRSDGQFTFATVGGQPIEPQAAAYTVEVAPDCYDQQQRSLIVPLAYPTDLSQTFEFLVDARPHGFLDVTVVDFQTGARIPGARVQVQGGDQGVSPIVRTVDANGFVHYCVPPTSAVRYVVSAGAEGYGTGSLQQTVVVGRTSTLTMRLVRAGNLCAVRVDARQTGRLVRLRDAVGTYDASQVTSNFNDPGNGIVAGTALFNGLAPGSYLAYRSIGSGFWQPVSGKPVTCRAARETRVVVP